MDDPLYRKFDVAKTDGFVSFDDRLPTHITDNLASHIELRPYQIEALNRYIYYCDKYKNRVPHNSNLLFNMATGSGKTVIMAALILDLYKRGYRKFVFFVNRKTIVQKTIENFTNRTSSKYLFADTISIDGHTPTTAAVQTLSSDNESDIQILFTTIQGLHEDLESSREGRLSLEDLQDEKLIMLSDEAHHINAWTTSEKLGQEEDISKKTWEHNVQKIFKQNPANMLLEFTATLGNDKRIHDKYKDVLIYKYDLKEFRNDGYSKDILLYSVSDDLRERMLQAILISQYRLLVAEQHGLLLKPVILFKSKNIQPSKDHQQLFVEMIQNLNEAEVQTEFTKHKTLTALGKHLADHSISLKHFVDELKIAFHISRIRNVNDEKEADSLQLDINHLEDADNEIRVIFAVDKLNEGWDVLNLFDIVRLYETHDGKYNRGGEYLPGKTTISEAQLIGRGARYWPFSYRTETDNQRKFDKDLTHDLRLLEEMYYHSSSDPEYLKEIRTALVATGMMDQQAPKTVELLLKDSFKKSNLYKNGVIYANLPEDNPHADKKSVVDYLNDTPQLSVTLPTKSVSSTDVFDETAPIAYDDSVKSDVIKFNTIPSHIVAKAIDSQYKFYNFTNLKQYLPEVTTKQTFIDMLGELHIKISGQPEDIASPSLDIWMRIATSVLAQLKTIVTGKDVAQLGSKKFTPISIKDVFREKKILIENAQGSAGTPMREEVNNLRLDLSHRNWYAYEDDFGTSYEKQLVLLIDRNIEKLKTKWDDIYLIRNERDLKLYAFDSDGVFMPDYVLYLHRNDPAPTTHYVFIEPKGENIESGDQWKNEFLQQLETTAEVANDKGNPVTNIKIFGMKFYKPASEGEFEAAFRENFIDRQ